MSFIGTYADITGYRIGGDFRVMDFIGRDRAGAPKWEVRCDHCYAYQVLTHAKATTLLESKATLQCTNAACRMSRPQPKAETLADIRRVEQRKVEEAAERRKAAEIEAANERAKQVRMDALKAEYRRYASHAMFVWDQQLDTLPTLQQWCQLGPDTRRVILERIETDPTVPLKIQCVKLQEEKCEYQVT